MKYKILRTDGNYDFHNNSTVTALPEGAIALTNEEWENRLQPSESQLFQSAKNAKLAQLESLRKAFQYANLEVNGHTYINTETAQNKFFNKLANTAFPMGWRLANLSWIILTEVEALEVRDAIVTRETLAYQTESDYFTEINACTTIEEVSAINITF